MKRRCLIRIGPVSYTHLLPVPENPKLRDSLAGKSLAELTRLLDVYKRQRFIGHGIGLEINEAPVLAPRIRRELEEGMVFALEPKIVLPGVGPVSYTHLDVYKRQKLISNEKV